MRDIQERIVQIAYEQTVVKGGTIEEAKKRADEIIQSLFENIDDVLSEVHGAHESEKREKERKLNERIPCHGCRAVYMRRQFYEWEGHYESLVRSVVMADAPAFDINKPETYDAVFRLCDMASKFSQRCEKCAEKAYNRHIRECDICEVKYYTAASIAKTNICHDCHNPVYVEERDRVYQHIARAEQLGLAANLTFKQWIETLHTFSWKCAYCSDDFACIEHFLPMSMGGGTSADNCIPACLPCNNKKHDRHPSQLDDLFPADNLVRIREYLSMLNN